MSIDSLLVRYKGGYFIEEAAGASGPGGRGYLELGQVETLGEARSIAQLELERRKQPLLGITLDADPRAPILADQAFVGWDVADYVNTLATRSGAADVVRVREIEVTQDDDTGELTITPALASRLEEQEARLHRLIRRRLNGALDGRSASTGSAQAAESVLIRRATKVTETFNWSGVVAELIDEVNGPKQFELDGRLVQIKYTWRTPPPTTDAEIGVFRNGTLWATHLLPAGTRTHREFPNTRVTRSQWFDMAVAAVDAAAEGLTAEWTVVYFS